MKSTKTLEERNEIDLFICFHGPQKIGGHIIKETAYAPYTFEQHDKMNT